MTEKLLYIFVSYQQTAGQNCNLKIIDSKYVLETPKVAFYQDFSLFTILKCTVCEKITIDKGLHC